MKKFMLQCALFFAVLVALNAALLPVRDPFWGNEAYVFKLEVFKSSPDEYNTAVLGSSRTFRQLDPARFDASLEDLDIRSFNLATAASFNPEVYRMYDRLLEDGEAKFSHAFIELTPVRQPHEFNLATARNAYWHDWPNTRYLVRFILASDMSLKDKRDLLTGHLRGSFYNFVLRFLMFNLDGVEPWAFAGETRKVLGPDGRGYFALEDEASSIKVREKREITGGLLKRMQRFDDDMKLLRERTARMIEGYHRPDTYAPKANPVHLRRLLEMIERSEEKGVKLVFVLAPRGSEDKHFELRAIGQALPAAHLIDLSNPNEYPEFYVERYAFDKAHLNREGSELFTDELARKARKLLSAEP